MSTNYQRNKQLEANTTATITTALNTYINSHYDPISITHIITDDKQLQQRGIDRITTITTSTYESITLTIDDKVQNRNLINDSIVLPYIREYSNNHIQTDYITSTYKQNNLIALYTTKSNHLILLNHTLLAHKLLVDDLYLTYANTYGYDTTTNEYYTFYNHVEQRGSYKSYSYVSYYYKLTLTQLLTDPLFKQSILDIIDTTTNTSVLQQLQQQYT